jgi:hypothetical protein
MSISATQTRRHLIAFFLSILSAILMNALETLSVQLILRKLFFID